MAVCTVCGNSSETTFGVQVNGRKYIFDSFECAAQALAPSAPTCSHCGCRVLGQGLRAHGVRYCGTQCAEQAVSTLVHPGVLRVERALESWRASALRA